MELKYKKQTFNSSELAMFFSAFGLKLFTRPKKGDIYSRNNPNGSCTFFYRNDYFETLKNDMIKSSKSGKFEESNAEDEWERLLFKVVNAVNNEVDEVLPTEDYYETMRKFWGE